MEWKIVIITIITIHYYVVKNAINARTDKSICLLYDIGRCGDVAKTILCIIHNNEYLQLYNCNTYNNTVSITRNWYYLMYRVHCTCNVLCVRCPSSCLVRTLTIWSPSIRLKSCLLTCNIVCVSAQQ